MRVHAPVVDPELAALLSGEPDPVERFRADQSQALMCRVYRAGTAHQVLKNGRIVLLECGHFTVTKALHRAKCSRCGEMIRAGYDYDGYRNHGQQDKFSWPDDPLRLFHEDDVITEQVQS